ncbi:MAG: SOS response-associated peptidase [Solirubrobacteraceae bacterium]
MCGRFTSTLGPQEIGRQLGEPLGVAVRESAGTGRYNVAPTQDVLTILAPDGQRQPRVLRWDLVPAFARTVKPPKWGPRINARVESLRSKRTYFGVAPDAAHRALIVADAFYEWPAPERDAAKRKLKPPPFCFTVDDGRAFCFAGLWTTAPDIEDGPVESCTIITCDASENRVVGPVHSRMPVILADIAEMNAWLDASVSSAEALSLCEPLPADRMSARRASKAVNNVNSPEGPDLLLGEHP